MDNVDIKQKSNALLFFCTTVLFVFFFFKPGLIVSNMNLNFAAVFRRRAVVSSESVGGGVQQGLHGSVVAVS